MFIVAFFCLNFHRARDPKGQSRVKKASKWVQKWWTQIAFAPTGLSTILWWVFTHAETRTKVCGSSQRTMGPSDKSTALCSNISILADHHLFRSSPSPLIPVAPLPTAVPPESQSSVSSTPIDLEKSLAEGLKEVLRAIPTRFRNLREKALKADISGL